MSEATSDGGMWAPLRHRQWAVMWGGFMVSHVGDSVQLHAQSWLVSTLAPRGVSVGAVAMAQAIPRLLLGLFAGVLVDRMDKRRLLVATQLLAFLQTLLFLALVATHTITYAWVLALAASLGVVDALNLNARMAIMPTLVPKGLIGRSVALQALGVNLVQIAGPSLAALLIGAFDVKGCLVANALSFLAALTSLYFVRPPPTTPRPSVSMSAELREGFAFVRAYPLLWGSLALAWLHGFFGVSAVRLYALFARTTLHTDGSRYGLLAACGGLGAIVASVLVTARAKADKLPRNIALYASVFSVTVVMLGLARSYAQAMFAVAALGFGQMAFRSAVTTTIQTQTPDALRGRVVSLLTLDFSLWSFGAIVVGALADYYARSVGLERALPSAFLTSGVVCMAVVCVLGPVVARAKAVDR